MNLQSGEARRAVWVVKTWRLAAAMPDDGLAPGSELPHGGRVRQALAEGRLPAVAVDAMAQAFEKAFAGQAGESLGDSGKEQIAEILKPPQPFAARLDPLAHQRGDF